ncbi:hypothetical protein C4D60_Mb01t30300 [Musa balbisiana]|uniref:Uncharacterized protein n=1 Tax=Musa balbisiana TaxID=52838 RepID=A0A4S8JRW2_MUSBA|nr:hypothetical protein C4D60_Mb01t30300 [Musa balbisiana]
MAHAHYSCEQLLGTGEEEADLLPASSILACLFFLLMDLVPPTDRLCYVRCTYCNTVLAVGVPCKRVMDTVTVKCGHCSHLSFLSPRAMVQSLTPTDNRMGLQGPCSDCLRGQPSPPSSSSSNSSEQMIQKPRFVMKPPEKKHRMPSAYNRFMKKYITQKPNHGREEIQRIKAAKPDIPHREAFSMASKNVSDITDILLLKRLTMAMSSLYASCNMNRSGPSVILVAQLLFRPPPITVVERVNCPRTENSKFCKRMEQKN